LFSFAQAYEAGVVSNDLMQILRSDITNQKGWHTGPWNSDLPISVGYANAGIDEPHLHQLITEVYLIARGTSVVRVERETITLSAGDVLVIEPGEAHTFLDSTPGYFHFVIHAPGLSGGEAQAEKSVVSRARLGL
jgi:mannose-6-phosphate isomerase-like protein (cupin superfamily)